MVAIARELPVSGYALEIDGRLKTEFATRDGTKTGARELKMSIGVGLGPPIGIQRGL